MAVVVEMPKLTDTMEEGVIVRWSKKIGEPVEPGDVLVEIETDKATMEYESVDRGVLLKMLVAEGSGVAPGTPIAVLGAAGEDVSSFTSGAPAPPDATAPAHAAAAAPAAKPAAPPAAAPAAPATAPAASATPPTSRAGRHAASPLVRRLAAEAGISIVDIAGTGPGGRIVKRDIELAMESRRAAPPVAAARAQAPRSAAPTAHALPTAAPMETFEPLSQMRKAIARRMTEAKPGVPHFYLSREIDADALHTLREQFNKDHPDSKVSYNDFIVRAVALALRAVPAMNSSFQGDRILRHGSVDVGVAVALPDGLVTPVLRSADTKTLLDIAREARELADRARKKRLRPEEMQGGSLTVSNLGMFGVESFSAIINPPEAGLLAVGALVRKPVVRGDEVVPGWRIAVTLSCDHRAVDGAIGATFLAAIADLLEHPTRLIV